jgi:hypothetical protein
VNFHLHHGPKEAGGNGQTLLAQLVNQIVNQRFGLFGWGGIGERRPSALPRIPIQGKLAYDKYSPTALGLMGERLMTTFRPIRLS